MKFSDREEDDVQINLTPLIDVVFLLLIFFMVSTTFSKESELRIKLPESSDDPVEQRENPVLEIEISAEGVYAVKGPGDESAKQPGDRVLLPLPLHHVYPFVVGLLAPLSLGVPVILPPSLTGPQMLRAMRGARATVIVGVPRLYRALAAAGGNRTELVTVIRADRETPHASVVRAMDMARRLGHTNITFATQQVMEEEKGQ